MQESLNTAWLGRTYLYLPVAGSTNDLLKEQVATGDALSPPAGTVLLADFQEHGRGRMSRRWEAPSGSSLLFSVLLRPAWPAERLAWLTMIGGLAVAEAVERHTGLAAGIKWPNDGVIELDGAWHKYCGILSEGHVTPGGSIEHAVLGIGVNVNIAPDQLPPADFPVTSLLVANARAVSRLELFVTILSRLEHHYERAERNQSPHAAWQARLVFLNKRVVITHSGLTADLVGTAVGTDDQGRLLVRDDGGQLHQVAAGDVSLRAHLET